MGGASGAERGFLDRPRKLLIDWVGWGKLKNAESMLTDTVTGSDPRGWEACFRFHEESRRGLDTPRIFLRARFWSPLRIS